MGINSDNGLKLENRPLGPECDFREGGYVVVVDKPLGWTSSDVVRKVKFMIMHLGNRRIKVGHAGTLDPLATGILIICIGKATKQAEALQSQVKEYVAEIELGATTPSYDREHEIDARYPWEHITPEMVDRAAEALCGERLQTPPIYSAKMIDGRRAYEYAREGSEVNMRQALITIHRIEIMECRLPYVKMRVVCSKGTYIRSLAKEMGELLGSGAYLTSLRRTASGDFRVEDAFTMEQIIAQLTQCRKSQETPEGNTPEKQSESESES